MTTAATAVPGHSRSLRIRVKLTYLRMNCNRVTLGLGLRTQMPADHAIRRGPGRPDGGIPAPEAEANVAAAAPADQDPPPLMAATAHSIAIRVWCRSSGSVGRSSTNVRTPPFRYVVTAFATSS